MKRVLFLLTFSLLFFAGTGYAQKWSELSEEQQLMKMQAFREDNQHYLKDTLGLTQDQLDDVDEVNLCYLGTLERIDRYAKDDAAKEKYAKAATAARAAQLDAIMGEEKRKQFSQYVRAKLKKGGMKLQ